MSKLKTSFKSVPEGHQSKILKLEDYHVLRKIVCGRTPLAESPYIRYMELPAEVNPGYLRADGAVWAPKIWLGRLVQI